MTAEPRTLLPAPPVHRAAAASSKSSSSSSSFRRLQNLPEKTPHESESSMDSSIPNVSTLRDEEESSPPIPRKKKAKVATTTKPAATRPTSATKPAATKPSSAAKPTSFCDTSDTNSETTAEFQIAMLERARAKKKQQGAVSVLEQHTRPPERSSALFPPQDERKPSETTRERKSSLGRFKGKKVARPKDDIGAWRVQPEDEPEQRSKPKKSRGVAP